MAREKQASENKTIQKSSKNSMISVLSNQNNELKIVKHNSTIIKAGLEIHQQFFF